MKLKELIILSLALLMMTSASAQLTEQGSNARYTIADNSNLDIILKDLSERFNILLAYPAPLVSAAEVAEGTLYYRDFDDLIHQLVEGHTIEVRKVAADKYLLRKKEDQEGRPQHSISGRVLDRDSGDALPWASVYLKDFSQGTFTDGDGGFSIESSANTQDSLIVSYLAYEDLILPISELSGKNNLYLKRAETVIENVTVEYVVPPLMISQDGRYLNLKDDNYNSIDKGNLLSDDVLRNVQLLAGVNAHDDDEASLKIRGSNSDQSLIIMNGMPLYNVDHYYGIFSAINPNFVQEVKFFRNNQPINYSGTGGGLLFLDGHNQSKKFEGIADINLLSTSAYLSLPLNDKVKINFGGRTTYKNVDDGGLINLKNQNSNRPDIMSLDRNTFISNEPRFKFYDYNLRIQWGISEKLSAAYNHFRSEDKYSNNYDLNFESEDSFVVINESFYSNNEDWSNTAHSLQLDYQPSKKISVKSNIHYSKYGQNSELNSTLIQNRNGTIKMLSIHNSNESQLKDWGYELSGTFSSEGHTLLVGADYNRYQNSNLLKVEDQNVLNLNPQSAVTSLFTNYSFKNNLLELQVGSRFSNYRINRKDAFIFSPQLSGVLRLGEHQKLKFSVGRTHQFLREIEYENRFSQVFEINALANGGMIPVLRTDNLMLGYTVEMSAWSLDVEMYKKHMDGTIQFSTSRPGFENGNGVIPLKDYKLYKGERNVLGMDLTLSFKHRWYSGWIAYTLSKSMDSYPAIYQSKEFSSQDDRRHQLKWINEFKVGNFTINNNFIFASGRPYLPLESLTNDQDRTLIDPDALLDRLPAYFRIDLGVKYQFGIKSSMAALSISMFNIMNRQNVKYLQYAYSFGNPQNQNLNATILGTEAELLDRTLNFGFELKF